MFKEAVCSDCYHPYEQWGDVDKKWEEFVCKCGSKHITGNRIVTRVFHIVCKKGEIPADPNKRIGAVWTIEKTAQGERLYVTCPDCDEINVEDTVEIDKDGFVGGKVRNSCIECGCGYHYWPFLEGWEKRRKSRVS